MPLFNQWAASAVVGQVVCFAVEFAGGLSSFSSGVDPENEIYGPNILGSSICCIIRAWLGVSTGCGVDSDKYALSFSMAIFSSSV